MKLPAYYFVEVHAVWKFKATFTNVQTHKRHSVHFLTASALECEILSTNLGRQYPFSFERWWGVNLVTGYVCHFFTTTICKL